MEHRDFIKFANSFQIKIDQTLSRILKLLEFVGNPHEKLKIIHVAGTNGKGSVCSFLNSILIEADFKAGKFTSPYLFNITDSISINNVNIEKNELDNIFATLWEAGSEASQFEIQIAAAFIYFLRNNVDIVVMETGLGGLMDATNVISAPLISVITKIDIDHKYFLGNTLLEIAEHKCGIIKQNQPTVSLNQEPGVNELIKNTCRCKNSNLIITKTPVINTPKGTNECFSYLGIDNIICGLSGIHQVENAALAIECAKFLEISDINIKAGIKNAKNPARFEFIRENVIFDGSHNTSGAQALKNSLDRYFKNVKKNYIMAFMADKEVEKMLNILNDGENYYFTEVMDNSRALSKHELCKTAAGSGIKGTVCEIKDAIEMSLQTGNLTVICGSLYLYSQTKI